MDLPTVSAMTALPKWKPSRRLVCSSEHVDGHACKHRIVQSCGRFNSKFPGVNFMITDPTMQDCAHHWFGWVGSRQHDGMLLLSWTVSVSGSTRHPNNSSIPTIVVVNSRRTYACMRGVRDYTGARLDATRWGERVRGTPTSC